MQQGLEDAEEEPRRTPGRGTAASRCLLMHLRAHGVQKNPMARAERALIPHTEPCAGRPQRGHCRHREEGRRSNSPFPVGENRSPNEKGEDHGQFPPNAIPPSMESAARVHTTQGSGHETVQPEER